MRNHFKIIGLLCLGSWLSGCVALLPLIDHPQPEEQCKIEPIKANHNIRRHKRFVRRLTPAEKRLKKVSKYVQNLSHTDAVVRIHAATLLGQMGPAARGAVRPLIRRLSDPHYWVRRTAAKSLGKIGDPRAIPPLRDVMRRDSDRYVRLTAANALQAF